MHDPDFHWWCRVTFAVGAAIKLLDDHFDLGRYPRPLIYTLGAALVPALALLTLANTSFALM